MSINGEIGIERKCCLLRRHLPHRERVHPSLSLYTVVVGQIQVGVPFPEFIPLAFLRCSKFIPKTM